MILQVEFMRNREIGMKLRLFQLKTIDNSDEDRYILKESISKAPAAKAKLPENH